MLQNTNCVALREYLALNLLFTFDNIFQLKVSITNQVFQQHHQLQLLSWTRHLNCQLLLLLRQGRLGRLGGL